jgi:cell division protein FtsB
MRWTNARDTAAGAPAPSDALRIHAMRLLTIALVALLVLVHVELWFSKSGVPRALELGARLHEQVAANDATRTRNEQLQAEVRDLKEGLEMVEEKARFELGMLKPDEILVQLSVARP